jgi:hypothetical protein
MDGSHDFIFDWIVARATAARPPAAAASRIHQPSTHLVMSHAAWATARPAVATATAGTARHRGTLGTPVGTQRTHRTQRAAGAKAGVVRCDGGGGGGPRPIDKRLDAVVATLPIQEVLYQCLDVLEVSGHHIAKNGTARRAPVT